MLKLKPSPMFPRNSLCSDALLQHNLQPHQLPIQSHKLPHQSHTMPHQSHTLAHQSHTIQPHHHSHSSTTLLMETKPLPSSYHRISAEAKTALDETRNDMAVRLPGVFPDHRRPGDDHKRLTPPPPPAQDPLTTPIKSHVHTPSSSTPRKDIPRTPAHGNQAPPPDTPTAGTSLPPLRRASYPRITMDTFGAQPAAPHNPATPHNHTPPHNHASHNHAPVEERTFVITAPDYDARFADELDRQAAIKMRGQLPPEAMQSTIYKQAVSKCQQWMNKYMD